MVEDVNIYGIYFIIFNATVEKERQSSKSYPI
jgi:hypothetical protein